MALRAVDDHPKLARLKSILKCGRGEAMGYLEALWHFTGRFTPQGNVGKYSDADIEAWIEWSGDAGRLIIAFVESNWLDRSREHRLLVHDWHEHADDATRLSLKRKKCVFLTACVGTVSGQCRDSGPETPTCSGLPEPEPEPEPGKERGEKTRLEFPPSKTAEQPGDDWFEDVYSRHPKKGDRGTAARYLSEVVESPGFTRTEFDRVHKLWCSEWIRDQGGKFAPKLCQWILDKGWKYPPGVAEKKNGNGSAPKHWEDPFKDIRPKPWTCPVCGMNNPALVDNCRGRGCKETRTQLQEAKHDEDARPN